jgi:hypothetical protein
MTSADKPVTKISPSLPNLSELLRDLNEDRDFTRFIKRGQSTLIPHAPELTNQYVKGSRASVAQVNKSRDWILYLAERGLQLGKTWVQGLVWKMLWSN